MEPAIPQFVCSELSREMGEPLYGTASHELVWFLLQYDDPWGAKAFEQSDLPEIVKERLAAALREIPGARLQFIKSRSDAFRSGKALFVVRAAESQPVMRHFHLERYADLLSIDLPAAAAGFSGAGGAPVSDPLFLVCTNGRRDPCCARYGPPFYRAMVRAAGSSVWQTTHVGGHRFAANSICFPHGIYYGRLLPDDAGPYVAAARRGEIYLSHLRGRAAYPEVAQAAEYFLRRETGMLGLEDFRLGEVIETAPQEWQVTFLEHGSGRQYSLRLQVEISAPIYRQSCWSDKTSSLVSYNFIEWKVYANS